MQDKANQKELSFSLVVLCYRAEESIIPFVKDLHHLFSWFKLDYELILVANFWENSKDRTPEVVKRLATEMPRTKVVAMPKKGAMGWDLRTGLDAANGDCIGFVDGDGQFPVDTILPPLYHILNRSVDIAKTYRVVRGDGFFRQMISTIFNNVFRILFGTPYRDVNSKPKIFRAEALRKMKLESNDWFIDAEIMIKAKQLGLSVVEYPIHFIENKERASFIRFSAIWEFVKNLYVFRFKKH